MRHVTFGLIFVVLAIVVFGCGKPTPTPPDGPGLLAYRLQIENVLIEGEADKASYVESESAKVEQAVLFSEPL